MIDFIKRPYFPHNNAELFLANRGLPAKKTIGYRYSPIKRMLPDTLELTHSKSNFTPIQLWSDNCLCFNNGSFQPETSKLPEGLTVVELDRSQIKSEIKNPLHALNLLTTEKCYQINITENTVIQDLKIEQQNTFQTEGNCLSLHLEINIGKNSRINLFDLNKSKANNQALLNQFVSIQVEENSSFFHHLFSEADESVSNTYNRKIYLGKSAQYKAVFFDNGLGYNRNDAEVVLAGMESNAELFGLYILKNEQFSDNFINVHHQAAHSTSKQLFKGILKGNSRAVFTGKVLVDAGANQVDSSQLNKNIILENTAQVQTEPQLEVYTDDVKCGHGATVGQLSDEEIFYLESRGIPRERAFRMLCQAYAEEILTHIQDQELKEFFQQKLHHHFDFSTMVQDLIGDKQ